MRSLLFLVLLLVAVDPVFAQSFADLVDSASNSVVTLYVTEEISEGKGDLLTKTTNKGLGSGVLVGEKHEYIITAAHVVGNASEILVEFRDGKTMKAKTSRISRTADVALIILDRPILNAKSAKIGDSDKVRVGDDVFIIGASFGLSYSVSKGIISGKHNEKQIISDLNSMEFFQTDAAINKGNSGGPMFNAKGEVIGIVSSILSFSGGSEGLGFAATSKITEDILLNRGNVWLGVDALPLNREMCYALNVPQEGALLVQSVAKKSAGYFMGLKGGFIKLKYEDEEFLIGGDVILSFDDIVMDGVSKIEELREYLNKIEHHKKCQVKILREGKTKELTWHIDN